MHIHSVLYENKPFAFFAINAGSSMEKLSRTLTGGRTCAHSWLTRCVDRVIWRGSIIKVIYWILRVSWLAWIRGWCWTRQVVIDHLRIGTRKVACIPWIWRIRCLLCRGLRRDCLLGWGCFLLLNDVISSNCSRRSRCIWRRYCAIRRLICLGLTLILALLSTGGRIIQWHHGWFCFFCAAWCEHEETCRSEQYKILFHNRDVTNKELSVPWTLSACHWLCRLSTKKGWIFRSSLLKYTFSSETMAYHHRFV